MRSLHGRALCPDDRVADHAGDHLVVPDAPEVDPLVPLDHRLGELVQLFVVTTVHVDVGERQPGVFAERVERLTEQR